jgi:TDG/mug DNA glycosylase family protein
MTVPCYAPAMRSALSDVLAPGLRIIFCGINPGRASAAAGAHYANPRNDFWRLLHAAKLTPRLLAPSEQRLALAHGLGLTNAVERMTPGSGDLRRSDYARSAARLTKIAHDLRPAWIGFVGKAAYQGTFGERAAHGLRARRLDDTQLFVLPSTSPANAAVSWFERKRWFQELAGRASGLPLLPAARAVVLDPTARILLVRFGFPDSTLWTLPGRGVEPGETDAHAIARELLERLGLTDPLGPCIWTREQWFLDSPGSSGQRERIYLVRLNNRPRSIIPAIPTPLASEPVTGHCWWTLSDLEAADPPLFTPPRLPALVRDLLAHGPPASPIDIGV